MKNNERINEQKKNKERKKSINILLKIRMGTHIKRTEMPINQ